MLTHSSYVLLEGFDAKQIKKLKWLLGGLQFVRLVKSVIQWVAYKSSGKVALIWCHFWCSLKNEDMGYCGKLFGKCVLLAEREGEKIRKDQFWKNAGEQ